MRTHKIIMLGLYLVCLRASAPKLTAKQWFDRGNHNFTLKQFAKASQCFENALEIALATKANPVAIYSNLSASKCKEGKFDQALQVALELCKLAPTLPKARFRIAQAMHGMKREREALFYAIQAWKFDPGEPLYNTFRLALQDLFPQDEIAELTRQALFELQTFPEQQQVQLPHIRRRRVPVTVLSGFLGSGKTTLLKRVLENNLGLKVAVLVNDMSEINIDAQLIKPSATSTTQVVELSNGCICCTLKDDLIREVIKLALQFEVDYICIESTGISEPMPVALAFSGAQEDITSGIPLPQVTRLDTMLTVVDASQFDSVFHSTTRLEQVGLATNIQDKRTLSELLTDQIEFANVILLNKTDLVPKEEDLRRMETFIKELNPTAVVIRTTQCEQVKLQGLVLNSHMFSFNSALAQQTKFRQELLFPHEAETEEYGFTSFAFQQHETWGFDSSKVYALLMNKAKMDTLGVWRAKGMLFVSQDTRIVLQYAKSGPNVEIKAVGFWNQATANEPKIELVFIGIQLQREALERELKAALEANCTLNPTMEGLGQDMYIAVFKHVYESVLGEQQRFALQVVTRQERMQQIKKRLTALANMDRDLNDDEMQEGSTLAAEYRKLRGG